MNTQWAYATLLEVEEKIVNLLRIRLQEKTVRQW